MISHPLDAPSNLSDSVSSMMRLLISNRIIAAGKGYQKKGGNQLLIGEINRFMSNSAIFFPPLTDQTASAGATSACHFRVFCAKDPMKMRLATTLPAG